MDRNPSPYGDDTVVGETDDQHALIMAGDVKCCMNDGQQERAERQDRGGAAWAFQDPGLLPGAEGQGPVSQLNRPQLLGERYPRECV